MRCECRSFGSLWKERGILYRIVPYPYHFLSDSVTELVGVLGNVVFFYRSLSVMAQFTSHFMTHNLAYTAMCHLLALGILTQCFIVQGSACRRTVALCLTVQVAGTAQMTHLHLITFS